MTRGWEKMLIDGESLKDNAFYNTLYTFAADLNDDKKKEALVGVLLSDPGQVQTGAFNDFRKALEHEYSHQLAELHKVTNPFPPRATGGAWDVFAAVPAKNGLSDLTQKAKGINKHIDALSRMQDVCGILISACTEAATALDESHDDNAIAAMHKAAKDIQRINTDLTGQLERAEEQKEKNNEAIGNAPDDTAQQEEASTAECYEILLAKNAFDDAFLDTKLTEEQRREAVVNALFADVEDPKTSLSELTSFQTYLLNECRSAAGDMFAATNFEGVSKEGFIDKGKAFDAYIKKMDEMQNVYKVLASASAEVSKVLAEVDETEKCATMNVVAETMQDISADVTGKIEGVKGLRDQNNQAAKAFGGTTAVSRKIQRSPLQPG